ncbi:MAG TPA: sulfatase-like hydrolase/transferase [Thermoanaerobaculia bacterium]|nr:sulfatase-like hydrolase/transferase [Thermoanaerobaculia bacterium]
MPRSAIAGLILGLFLAGGLWAAERPNIVFITSDDHRWDALGAAGNRAVHTPALDRLAADGVYFRQATVHVSQCLPSRATLLTGLTAHQHGVLSHQHQRPEAMRRDAWSDLPTLPGLLRQAGYTTVLTGKWHLEADPWRTGFSHVRRWFPQGAPPYKDPLLAQGESRETAEVKGYTQEIFSEDAIAFLQSPEAQGKPFFLWLAFTAPHFPFEPNPPHLEALYKDKPVADLLPAGFPKDVKMQDWRLYYQAVSVLDEQVGRVREAIAKAGLAENTLLIFLGDNGFMMGQRGIGAEGAAGKAVPYEASVRVPFLAVGPGLGSFPKVNDLPASTLDLPPTLLALAGVEPPASWPGRNLLTAKIEDAFIEWADDAEGGRFPPFRMVRTARHKLIVWKDPAKPDELYDQVSDPAEEKNLIADPAAQEVKKDLEARLRSWLDRTADPAKKWPKLAA